MGKRKKQERKKKERKKGKKRRGWDTYYISVQNCIASTEIRTTTKKAMSL